MGTLYVETEQIIGKSHFQSQLGTYSTPLLIVTKVSIAGQDHTEANNRDLVICTVQPTISVPH